MRRVIVCTTFRDFNGTENDRIQKLFIESMIKQTYSNWILVVTIFNEKYVEQVLREYKIPIKIYNIGPTQYKYSLTEVLINGIDSIEGEGKDVIIWTTCDVIFEETFFENIVKNFREGMCGTSHPHLIYKNIDEYNKNEFIRPDPRYGIDTVLFDADIFINNHRAFQSIKSYKFIGWGLFEHFLVGIGRL
jgi:hypothetical protein